jgi:hypothetical protein
MRSTREQEYIQSTPTAEKTSRTSRLEDLGEDGTILKWILKTHDWRVWTVYTSYSIGKSGGLLLTL